MAAPSGFLANRYVKYIFIALVLAATSQALSGYLLDRTARLQEKIIDLDKEVAVMEARVNYLVMLSSSQNKNDSSLRFH